VAALVRFRSEIGPQLGTLDNGAVTPSGLGDESWADRLASWAFDNARLPTAGRPIPVNRLELLPPLTESCRVFCVAQNYPAHAAEAGGASPPRPIVFLKPPSAFVGHDVTVALPAASSFFDYEGEIAVVMGGAGGSIRVEDAAGLIAGYTIANDGSARDLQPAILADRFQVDWFAAKSFDRGSALGPAIVRARTLPSLASLRIRTSHNGALVQDDVAGSMFHPVANLVSFVSHIVGLRPGDVILTGTPAGVGKARGVALAPGDVVTVSVTGIGELTTRYVSAPDARTEALAARVGNPDPLR
jgi:2-keto-4-pentenoate hydratase/2-oxohepta-3-ene-1,7-dioic acid hydratase in catechol pathway